MTTVSLVRHGLVHNPDQVYYGRLAGFSLADEGRSQAAAAGRQLAEAGVAAVYHSPMLRARQTAEIVLAHLPSPVPLAECAGLNEIHSPYDGRSAAEMERRDWDFYTDIDHPYERPADVLARVIAFFDFARHHHAGSHVVGVSHADPIAFAIMWACGMSPSAAGRKRLVDCGVVDGYPAPASISTFSFGADGGEALAEFRYRRPYVIPRPD